MASPRGSAIALATLVLSRTALASPLAEEAFERHMAEGTRAYERHDCGTAEKSFLLAVGAAERLGPSDSRLIRALSNLGGVQDQLGAEERATASYRRALSIVGSSTGKDRPKAGALWYNFGTLRARHLKRLERSSEVERAFKNAIAAYKGTSSKRELGKAYTSLGGYYRGLDREAEAESSYRRARSLLRASRSFTALSVACTNLAYLLSESARMAEAWDAYDCALKAAEDAGGLVARSNRSLLAHFAAELREQGLGTKAEPIDAMIAQIDALPPPAPESCRGSVEKTLSAP